MLLSTEKRFVDALLLRGTAAAPLNISNYSLSNQITMPTDVLNPKLIIDVGMGYGSGLMAALGGDPSLVLLGIEGYPTNFKTCYANMFKNDQAERIPNIDSTRSRVVLGSTLVSASEGEIRFFENESPLFGSVLETDTGGDWTTQTSGTTRLPTTTLAHVLAQIPTDYSLHYLNINVNEACQVVIEGGGKAISGFNMISVDCPRSDVGRMEWSVGRKGGCSREALDFKMRRILGFEFSYCGRSHCHYARSQLHLSAITHLFRQRDWETRP